MLFWLATENYNVSCMSHLWILCNLQCMIYQSNETSCIKAVCIPLLADCRYCNNSEYIVTEEWMQNLYPLTYLLKLVLNLKSLKCVESKSVAIDGKFMLEYKWDGIKISYIKVFQKLNGIKFKLLGCTNSCILSYICLVAFVFLLLELCFLHYSVSYCMLFVQHFAGMYEF